MNLKGSRGQVCCFCHKTIQKRDEKKVGLTLKAHKNCGTSTTPKLLDKTRKQQEE